MILSAFQLGRYRTLVLFLRIQKEMTATMMLTLGFTAYLGERRPYAWI
jgi:hypothetical protein